VIHTPATARKAASMIPNTELHDDVVARRSDAELLEEWDRKEWRGAKPRLAQIFADFLRRNAGRGPIWDTALPPAGQFHNFDPLRTN